MRVGGNGVGLNQNQNDVYEEKVARMTHKFWRTLFPVCHLSNLTSNFSLTFTSTASFNFAAASGYVEALFVT